MIHLRVLRAKLLEEFPVQRMSAHLFKVKGNFETRF